MTRRILYLTGTRADFGLMLPTLQRMQQTPGLHLDLCVTGMHLSRRFGHTIDEVRASELPVVSIIDCNVDADTHAGMAAAAARVATGFGELLTTHQPDLCLLLGDRWETLAAAMSATLAGVPIVHVCGGERSGSVDDALRHAVSKLAHVHAVTTQGSRERLLRMGEEPARIHVVGAPGLVGLRSLATRTRESWAEEHGLDAARPIAALLFHPVVQDALQAGEQAQAVIHALMAREFQALCMLPNADAGNGQIRSIIEKHCRQHEGWRAVTHLSRGDYVSLIAGADVLVGNSSSGIVEAASLGTPVVNVGDRQQGRERNSNTVDCEPTQEAIADALERALSMPRQPTHNVYGDGRADEKIAHLLVSLNLDQALLKKSMSY